MSAMLKRAFTEHPASVGETYFQHMGAALGFGARMMASGLACMIHGAFPFLFKTTGRRCIEELHSRMVVNRDRRRMPAMPPTGSRGGHAKLRAAE